ncbi:MAG: hypothetical protein ACLPGW_00045 [Roseiarcus sp.]
MNDLDAIILSHTRAEWRKVAMTAWLKPHSLIRIRADSETMK